MKTLRIKFKNRDQINLSARLELPIGYEPEQFAIFAHCFTCGKNIKAATLISRQLTQSGFGVLRFDFTGLGQSEGDFAETGFTSNIQDLEAAADYLTENYRAPQLILGHSLGGTAAIHAAGRIESIKAVCTISAPFEAHHVMHMLRDSREQIREKGRAEVSIGGRPFEIGNTFLEDIEKHSTASVLPDLKKPILILHSPQDDIVGIDNAAELYGAAHHPKSFVTLDGANHLVSNETDATYVANIAAAWVSRYIKMETRDKLKTDKHVAVQLGSDGFTTEIVTGKHNFFADEPKDFGGNDMGPSPYQLLNAALGACTAMTLKMYADRKEWSLEKVEVHLGHEKVHAKDGSDPETKKSKIDKFERAIELEGDLDDEQREKLLDIAEKCPVHRTLTETEVQIHTKLRTAE